MSGAQQMPSVRRRIPGMTAQPGKDATQAPAVASPPATETLDMELRAAPADDASKKLTEPRPERRAGTDPGAGARPPRQPAVDYTSTRLVNFRIPTDLHDRFRALVREAEATHPRLRKQSLTELVIALLEEGPETPDEVAELIRRKRAREHAEI